ncbi:MAG: 16S rRNA (cytidine(1402)-2'-O)-methyltransferase [Nitriliruptoraceae bacterium]
MDGTLSVVATPIGNLGDLTVRAVEVLRTVDLVLAEDTRRTGRLLAHIESGVPQLSLHEHNERDRLEEILARLEAGEHLALVSDAGTPTVSDPGYRLLAACAQRGVRIVPVPGASAALAALVVSGFPTDRVVLDGFLPRKGVARRERLAALADEPRTTVLFLSPHRAEADLVDLVETAGGERRAVLCRELTKLHEEVQRGTLSELAAVSSSGLRGEVTLVLAGAQAAPAAEVTDAELVERVRGLVATGTDRKVAIGEVARAVDVPRRRVYQAVIDAKRAG